MYRLEYDLTHYAKSTGSIIGQKEAEYQQNIGMAATFLERNFLQYSFRRISLLQVRHCPVVI